MRVNTFERRRFIRLSSALAPSLALAIGCAAATTSREEPMASPSVVPSDGRTGSGSSRLTAVELQGIRALSTFDAVRKLRPEFLQASARSVNGVNHGQPSLYVNGVYNGEVSLLNTIPLTQIREISFVQPVEARLLFGTTCACGGGVLLVRTQRERIP